MATIYGVPAAAGVIAIEGIWMALQGATTTPITEVVGGGATGGVLVGAVAWALYKAKVDTQGETLKELAAKKADRDALEALDKRLEELHKDVREIRDALRER